VDSTLDLTQGAELMRARKIIIHIINSLSASSKLKGVHIDDIVSYSESLGIYPESVIGVIQQLAKEGLVIEPSKNRFLNRFPPITIPKKSLETDQPTPKNEALELKRESSDDLKKMASLLETSHIRLSPQQLLQVQREYDSILRSGNADLFYDGYPSDAEIAKRVGVDKRKIQGARVLLGLLTERDVKIDFDYEKFLQWLSTPKTERKNSRDFAAELGVSYSTFKRKRALWEAYLVRKQVR
jgi:hypothetical protein